jgi:deferrochelatase/peroxidase EfeB
MGGVEPFGFVDGISQPEIDWGRTRPVEDRDRLDYSNLTCLGEFLLGYPNEYGLYTDRPLLDPGRDPTGLLPRAEDRPDLADLGRNGSYLVMRQLSQDAQGFWQYLQRQAGGDLHLARRWAEAMVGRAMDGTSLVDSGGDANAFTYASDPEGVRCPLGAHIRRANPRNADLPPGGPGILSRLKRTLGFDAEARARDLVASTRFHRLLRRGREYGVPMTLDQALSDTAVVEESGLHFICLTANIGRQFEFVQSAWMVGTKFDGLQSEGDPLLGHRQPGPDGQPTDCFSIPRPDGPDQRLCGLPHFVTVRGGAYFFLPGIRALRYLASTH